MNLTIAVDELDVVEVEVGQKVKITVDALSDAEMDGEVYKIGAGWQQFRRRDDV